MEPVYSPNRLAHLLGFPRCVLSDVAERAESLYRPFTLERPRKKPRPIDNPVGLLKHIQKRIYRTFLRSMDFPAYVHGGVQDWSAARNARLHVGKKCVVTIDVAGCYPSITNAMVFKVWRYTLGHSPSVARLLTRLVTAWGHLPQGAPTSLALANVVLLPVVRDVDAMVSAEGLSLGQYVDDSAISGTDVSGEMLTEICKVFFRAGLRISRTKLAVMRSGKCQVVTGHTVNTKVGIPKKNRSRVRAAVRELERERVDSPEGQKKVLSVRGRVNHLMRFHPTIGQGLSERLARLPGPLGTL